MENSWLVIWINVDASGSSYVLLCSWLGNINSFEGIVYLSEVTGVQQMDVNSFLNSVIHVAHHSC
jgi:hypothetical protein